MRWRRALAAVVTLAACSPFGPRPDPTRFYVLAGPSSPAASPSAQDAVSIGLGPVSLPSYLARPELATRVGPNQIAYSRVARWAEPLPSNIAHVLARTLEAELGTAEVTPFPSFGAPRLDYTVQVDMRRFEVDGDGAATLAAFWAIRDGRSRTVLATRETSLTERATVSDTAAGVAALSRALGGLGHEIALGIQQVQAGRASGQRRAR
jgi:uncharacterized lipoprotein YmbA